MTKTAGPVAQDETVTFEEGYTPEIQPTAADASAALLEILASVDVPEDRTAIPDRISGIVVGRVVAVSPGTIVAWAGARAGVAARAMVALDAASVGREVALMFEGGEPGRPVVIGLMEPIERAEVTADGERVVVSADRELVLSCGDASITLTRAGKILIRGAYVSSHATTVQRIRGGTVEIN